MNAIEFSSSRHSGRVVVGVSGSPGSLAALVRAVQEARRREQALVLVTAWAPVGGEGAARRAPSPELDALHRRDAHDRLRTAVTSALGGMPEDIPVVPTVVRDEPAHALLSLATHPGDLLVLGGGPRHRPARLLRGATRRRVAARAQAPVLLVPPPVLGHRVRRGLRGLTADDFRSTAANGLAC
jgi:nucleotide-binding universal stress UspA family protein